MSSPKCHVLIALLLILLCLRKSVVINKYKVYFSGNHQSIISFMKIKKLIRSLLSLNCQYVPQNKRTSLCQNSRKVGS